MKAVTRKEDSATTNDLAQIVEPSLPMLAELDAFMLQQIGEFEPDIQDLVEYTFLYRGKRLRPILVFTAGWEASTNTRPKLIQAAAVIEMVHLATLVHDDILDDADIRHNSLTISRKHGSDTAVLLGDALFAQALKLAAEFPTPHVCRQVAAATRRVCAGEIAQTLQRGNAHISLQDYHRIVDYKTAELFRVSTRLGAELNERHSAFCNAAETMGRQLGIAYQVFDDLVDYLGCETKAGKTLGTDLASGKFTLPLILLRQQVSPEQKAMLDSQVGPQGQLTRHQLNLLLETHDIFSRVRDYALGQLSIGTQALAPYDGDPAAEKLKQLARYLQNKLHEAVYATTPSS